MAILLNIDASAAHLYVSISKAGKMLAEAHSQTQKNHAADLQPMVAEVLAGANLEMKELQGVVLLNGPGSYTGLRVALSAAKGYCFALQIPLFCISNMACLAHAYFLAKPESEEIYVAISPMKGELFIESYSQPIHNNKNVTILKLDNLEDEKLKHLLSYKPFCGALSDEMREQFLIKNYFQLTLDSRCMNELGFAFYQNNWAENLANAEPYYIKAV
jgi:tRNA threonylcarbamoyladenosine biosynthesis protein TsaB